MLLRDLLAPGDSDNIEDTFQNLNTDIKSILAIKNTRYLRGRHPLMKLGNLNLAWEYAQSAYHHKHFLNMLRVSPEVFDTLLLLINDDPVFQNNSTSPQAPIRTQLAVTLYRMGRFGNGASVEDVARTAGCSPGAVEKYTERCFKAINGLHNLFVRPLTTTEKEREKQWVDAQLGFVGMWREGWVMYDGTIVVLYAKPGLNGDAYYTRKGNYGLNVQVRIKGFHG